MRICLRYRRRVLTAGHQTRILMMRRRDRLPAFRARPCPQPALPHMVAALIRRADCPPEAAAPIRTADCLRQAADIAMEIGSLSARQAICPTIARLLLGLASRTTTPTGRPWRSRRTSVLRRLAPA